MADRPTFHAVPRQAVSDAVHEQLRNAILEGAVAPGATLPSERTLAGEFGVNRHAVREAVKRLQEARLVEVVHGGATRVLDWRQTAGLEVLTDLALSTQLPGVDLLRAVMEMRRCIGVDAARLAARRAPDDLLSALRERIAGTRDQLAAGAEFTALAGRYDSLWRLIVRGSDNVAYELADNSLVDAIQRFGMSFADVYEPEVRDIDLQQALVDTITARDGDQAAALAERMLSRMVDLLDPAAASTGSPGAG
jgi:GntR family transcriptional repressor for pyruvate dehydrogenase complex